VEHIPLRNGPIVIHGVREHSSFKFNFSCVKYIISMKVVLMIVPMAPGHSVKVDVARAIWVIYGFLLLSWGFAMLHRFHEMPLN
jgi:hypothetical protein